MVQMAASGSVSEEISRAGVRPIWSPSAAVMAVPRLPRPKEKPSIMPEAMPSLPGIARWAQTRELGWGASSRAPVRKSATSDSGSVPGCR